MAAKANNELISFATVPLAAVVGAFVIAAAICLFVVRHMAEQAHVTALTNQAADSAMFELDERETSILERMQDAATNRALAELITSGDKAAIAAEEAELSQLFPDAIRVRLFPLQGASRDMNENPPFSFTSLDMVNKVETGHPVHPEAIKNNGSWILSVAAPIKATSGDTVHGTLFAYLNMGVLSEGLDKAVNGEVTVIQTYGNLPSNDILTIGQKAPNALEVTRSLDNPEWRIKFAPSAKIMNAPLLSPVLFLLPELVFLVIGLAGALFGVVRLLARTNEDASLLANQMADVIAGDYEPTANYTIKAFVDLDANLSRLGRRAEDKPEVARLDVKLQPKEIPEKERVDVELIDEDEFEQAMAKQRGGSPAAEEPDTALAEIFRAYDIRGIVNDTLTPEVIKRIGLAIGSEAAEQGEPTLIVGADGRISSPAVVDALIEGLTESGRDVINIGTVPTPVMYFAIHNSETRSGVMVTASHNPPEYNGFKIVLDGRTLVEEDIQRIWQRYQSRDFTKGSGNVTEIDITNDYIEAITDDVVVAQPLKVIVDCGNGVAGSIAPELFENLGCDVLPLYCDVDGNFPNHPPDPLVPDNLKDLILTVKSEGADLGIALDGDGDRLVAVTGKGEIVWPDRLLMLFAKDVVSRNPGSDVVYDVKCTRHLNSVISSFGGRPVICRSGHSYVKAKISETGALLGGEMSGHICFAERWFGFDDGLYSAARLLEIVGSQSETLAELLSEFPTSVVTPELHIEVSEADKFRIVDELIKNAHFDEGTVTTIDGLRVDFAEGWGLVRASNTGPNLTLRFEADNNAALGAIEGRFRELLHTVDESLDF